MSSSTVAKMVLTVATLAIAGPAFAKDGEVRTNSKGEQVICRKVQSTGSRMSKKVCRTPEEWKMMLDGSNTASIRK
jgi:hypothetical protein